jgi:dihydrolipoamide dehydrogenase
VLEALPDLLSGIPRDVVKPVALALKKSGAVLLTDVRVQSFAGDGEDVLTTYTEGGAGKTVGSEIVIVAAGRKPCTREIGLEAAGVHLDEKGFVPTDNRMRTEVPGIYAIGDITGKQQLAHVASAQGVVAADDIAGLPAEMRYDAIPACVYTTPEIATVGMTLEQALEEGMKAKAGSFPTAANGRSMIHGVSGGGASVVIDEDTGGILGAQLCGANVTEMIAEIALAMNSESTVEELADTVHPHPSVSEILMEAAHDFEGLSAHKL